MPSGLKIAFVDASLSEGFVLGETHLITDSEIFGWQRPAPRARQKLAAETPEGFYADLRRMTTSCTLITASVASSASFIAMSMGMIVSIWPWNTTAEVSSTSRFIKLTA